MCFIDLEKEYDRVNREALWEILRMYDMGSKVLSAIKSMHVDSSAYVRVNGGESERFRIDSGMRCIYGWTDEGCEDRDGKEVNEIPGGRERVEIAWLLMYK